MQSVLLLVTMMMLIESIMNNEFMQYFHKFTKNKTTPVCDAPYLRCAIFLIAGRNELFLIVSQSTSTRAWHNHVFLLEQTRAPDRGFVSVKDTKL